MVKKRNDCQFLVLAENVKDFNYRYGYEIMVFVKPFNKEHEKIFRRLMQSNIAYSNDINLSRSFGRHYSKIIDQDLLDIARIEKKKKTIFVSPPDIRIVFNKGKFFFYRIK